MSVSPSSQKSGRRGIRTHIPAVEPHGLANRPGEPYPATFRIQWTHRESNSDFRHARAVSSRWTMSPYVQWTGRGIEPRSPGCKPGIFPLDEPPMSEVRLGIEPSLPPYQSGVQPQHLQTIKQ